jgi:hypothetical protein
MFRRHAFRKYNRKFFATNGASRTNLRISASFDGRLLSRTLAGTKLAVREPGVDMMARL